MGEEHVHEMLRDACFRAGAEIDFTADLRAYLVARGISAEDVDALVHAPRRLGLYRRLVRHNLEGVTHTLLRRTRARLGAAFDETFDAFLDEVGPRTHYLRDVPREFLTWALPRWKARADLPAYISDFADNELGTFAVGSAPRRLDLPILGEMALDRPLLFADGVRLARYAHAVHELPVAPDDRTVPTVRSVSLLAYRDEANDVRFLELTPLAARIVDELMMGSPLGVALATACRAQGWDLDDVLLADIARVIADLGERGVVLGARAA